MQKIGKAGFLGMAKKSPGERRALTKRMITFSNTETKG